MISFKQFVSESISDKGIFKAIFIVGIPGAGKSHTQTKLHGQVSPRIINTDRAVEYLSKKFGKPVNSETWPDFKDSAHRITAGALQGYLDGALPLFIDGTSNDVSNILSRVGILESLGYDVGMVYINASLETAIKRAQARAQKNNRHVDEEFIRRVHALSEENKAYFKSKFSFYKEITNDDNTLTDELLQSAFKGVQGFFNEELHNPVGKRIKEKMITQKEKFLTPNIFTPETLKKKLDGWYRE